MTNTSAEKHQCKKCDKEAIFFSKELESGKEYYQCEVHFVDFCIYIIEQWASAVIKEEILKGIRNKVD